MYSYPELTALDVGEASVAIGGPLLSPADGGRLLTHATGRGGTGPRPGEVHFDVCDFELNHSVVRVAISRHGLDSEQLSMRFDVTDDPQVSRLAPAHLHEVTLDGTPLTLVVAYDTDECRVLRLAVNAVPVYYMAVWSSGELRTVQLTKARGHIPYAG